MANLFERQLGELHEQMNAMGVLCERIITLSEKAIRQPDKTVAAEVFGTDGEIDAKEKEIESLCMRLLLHQRPVAGDLRTVSAALKMISDMERIGDQCADIADLSLHIDRSLMGIPGEIEEMARLCVGMVTESIVAFVKNDLQRCRMVINQDDLVDDAFNRVKEELAGLLARESFREEDAFCRDTSAQAVLDLLMTAKYLERIGDHAVNIAEWVEYSITGVHRNNEHQRKM